MEALKSWRRECGLCLQPPAPSPEAPLLEAELGRLGGGKVSNKEGSLAQSRQALVGKKGKVTGLGLSPVVVTGWGLGGSTGD